MRKANRTRTQDNPIPRKRTKKVKSDEYASNNKKPLVPLNARQKEYIEAIRDYSIIICTGVWGSSKTYIPSIIAADALGKNAYP